MKTIFEIKDKHLFFDGVCLKIEEIRGFKINIKSFTTTKSVNLPGSQRYNIRKWYGSNDNMYLVGGSPIYDIGNFEELEIQVSKMETDWDILIELSVYMSSSINTFLVTKTMKLKTSELPNITNKAYRDELFDLLFNKEIKI